MSALFWCKPLVGVCHFSTSVDCIDMFLFLPTILLIVPNSLAASKSLNIRFPLGFSLRILDVEEERQTPLYQMLLAPIAAREDGTCLTYQHIIPDASKNTKLHYLWLARGALTICWNSTLSPTPPEGYLCLLQWSWTPCSNGCVTRSKMLLVRFDATGNHKIDHSSYPCNRHYSIHNSSDTCYIWTCCYNL